MVNSLSDIFAGADVQAITGLLACMGTYHAILQLLEHPARHIKKNQIRQLKLKSTCLACHLCLCPLFGCLVVWLFGLSARSHKKYFQETWMDGGSQSKMDLIKLLVWIQIKGQIQDFFSLHLKL